MNLKFLYCPIENIETARKIAKNLILGKIAVCVNILPKGETYVLWDGDLSEGGEYIMMIKVTAQNHQKAVDMILTHHDYQCPAILTLNIEDANQAFKDWVSTL